jgi:hypothetical protein
MAHTGTCVLSVNSAHCIRVALVQRLLQHKRGPLANFGTFSMDIIDTCKRAGC